MQLMGIEIAASLLQHAGNFILQSETLLFHCFERFIGHRLNFGLHAMYRPVHLVVLLGQLLKMRIADFQLVYAISAAGEFFMQFMCDVSHLAIPMVPVASHLDKLKGKVVP